MNHDVTDDAINTDDEFIKNEYYIKRDKIKSACLTETAEIPMNEEYDYDLMRDQNYEYLALTKPNTLQSKSLPKHNCKKFNNFVLTAFGLYHLMKY